ncbi:MAG: Initiator RepB protein family [uncultured bacterium]|nr:MAG: Initiator RepB protein family [uncultured bacterium]
MINERKLSKNLPVVKNDNLIYARYNSTQTGMKIIYIAASKIKSDDMALKEFFFSVKEFCEMLEIKNTGKYDKLKKACESLIQSYVHIETEKGWKLYPWFHHIEYLEHEGIFKVQFHEYLAPYLLYVKNNIYTKISLHSVLSLNSQYSMRFYEICSQSLKYKNTAEKIIELKELKLMFGIDKDEYPKYGNFKQKVLLQAQKEINEKADVYFEFEEYKEARKVVEIKFSIRRNNQKQEKEELLEKYQRQMKMTKEELSEELQRTLLEKYDCFIASDYIYCFHRNAIQATIDGISENEFNLRDKNKAIVFFKRVLENKHTKYNSEK